jgi:hypothetical protein
MPTGQKRMAKMKAAMAVEFVFVGGGATLGGAG